MLELTADQSHEKELIENAASAIDISIQGDEWFIDPDESDRIAAKLGRWQVIDGNDDIGLYEDDKGVLTVSCVGSAEIGNLRVAFHFTPDEMDVPVGEVVPFDQVEPL